MSRPGAPRASVIMANRDGAAHVAAAVRSVLDQTETALELLFSDDGSKDASIGHAQAAAAGDPRLIVLRSDRPTGPAAARNRALDAARGDWIAIVDSDDLIAPPRLGDLIAAAEWDGADIAVDDLLVFHADGASPPHLHVGPARAPGWIDAAEYVRSNRVFGKGGQLGYLKPLFRRAALGAGLRYDEALLIGEDMDLVLRLLMSGARMRFYPSPGYVYRKHASSISHRLTPARISAMLAALDRLPPAREPVLAKALRQHRAALLDAGVYEAIVAALKRGALGEAFRSAMGRPGALPLLRLPLLARLWPMRRQTDAAAEAALQQALGPAAARQIYSAAP